MGVTYDDDRRDDLARTRDYLTAIVLEERDDGGWLATQGGVPVEGRGDTAAEAAANYCRKIDERDDDQGKDADEQDDAGEQEGTGTDADAGT